MLVHLHIDMHAAHTHAHAHIDTHIHITNTTLLHTHKSMFIFFFTFIYFDYECLYYWEVFYYFYFCNYKLKHKWLGKHFFSEFHVWGESLLLGPLMVQGFLETQFPTIIMQMRSLCQAGGDREMPCAKHICIHNFFFTSYFYFLNWLTNNKFPYGERRQHHSIG